MYNEKQAIERNGKKSKAKQKGDDNMLAGERHELILQLLRKKGLVKVQELKHALNVSEVTIRKDLDDLHESGHLQRCHGGALKSSFSQKEQTFAAKACVHTEAKRKIATYCTSFVKPNMTVFLDNGTTIFEIAKAICNITDLSVVTTDLRIAHYLLDTPVEVTMIGGTIQKATGSVGGYFSEQMLKEMRFDLAFFGASSVNEKLEVMTPTAEKAAIKKMVHRHAMLSILTVDSSKFNKQALYQVNPLSAYTMVVTDYKWNQTEAQLILDQLVNVASIDE